DQPELEQHAGGVERHADRVHVGRLVLLRLRRRHGRHQPEAGDQEREHHLPRPALLVAAPVRFRSAADRPIRRAAVAVLSRGYLRDLFCLLTERGPLTTRLGPTCPRRWSCRRRARTPRTTFRSSAAPARPPDDDSVAARAAAGTRYLQAPRPAR